MNYSLTGRCKVPNRPGDCANGGEKALTRIQAGDGAWRPTKSCGHPQECHCTSHCIPEFPGDSAIRSLRLYEGKGNGSDFFVGSVIIFVVILRYMKVVYLVRAG